MTFHSEIYLEDWEWICQQLQKRLTKTYAQFGSLAGCQLVVIPIESTEFAH
jgi:hypothetical protein